ncbi:MAG: S8 family serine peptidase [Nocardioides sp.]
MGLPERADGGCRALPPVRRRRRSPGHRLDVLNLSMGFYPETVEEERSLHPTLFQALRILSRSGTVVVCSAGNDGTARRALPAAYAGHPKLDGAPVVAVGARNPNGTVALFSNTGSWVTTYAPGASVLSTMPPLRGGILPSARTRAFGECREGVDPDDFTRPERDQASHEVSRVAGFGLWSGTSFAAPVVAGEVAAAIAAAQGAGEDVPEQAVSRGQKAVEEVLRAAP